MNEKNRLMRKIQMLDFMLIDLSLYLDTHPECANVIEYYNKYRQIRNQVYDEYVSKFGSFVMTNQEPTDRWDWVNNPWPWEKEAN